MQKLSKKNKISINDFESNLIRKNNGKQNPDESYKNKYHNQVGCSFGCKFVRVNDQFTKHFKPYLGQDVVDKFITSIVKKSNIVERNIAFAW